MWIIIGITIGTLVVAGAAMMIHDHFKYDKK